MINKYIQLNQSTPWHQQDHFLNLIIEMPEILEFESKRILWRQCIKKYLKKKNDDEYEIDVQVRRNHVFGDSYEQLRDIPLENWR